MSFALVTAGLLAIIFTSSNGFLTPYQNRLEELNRQTIDLLSSSHASNSELQKTFIEQDVLVYLGNATFQLQHINRNVTYQMRDFRDLDSADHICLDTIDASIYGTVFMAEFWLQLCADGLNLFLSRDAIFRFFPVANQVHRDSTEIVRATLETLGEVNAIHGDGDEAREMLNATVSGFEEALVRAQQELTVELEKHAEMSEDVLYEFHRCVEDLYFYFEVEMYNLLWFARDTCLEIEA